MRFREYVTVHKDTEEVFFYLFDASEWAYLTKNEKYLPNIYTCADSLEMSEKKCFQVFIDQEEIKSVAGNEEGEERGKLVIMRPKQALFYLLGKVNECKIDGVLYNGCYYVQKESLQQAYQYITVKYYAKTLEVLESLQDEDEKTLHFIRSFFFLPKIYILGFKENAGILCMKSPGLKKESSIFIFDQKSTGDSFIEEMNFNNDDIESVELSTIGLIHKKLNFQPDFIWINGIYKVAFEKFVRIETIFCTVK